MSRRLLVVAVFAVLSAVVSAHDIPTDVRIQTFLKPQGTRLRLLVRLPVASTMNDVEWPVEGARLDLARADAAMRQAARDWVAGRVELRENDRVLERARVVAARISQPSDRSFASWETALAHVTDPPLPAGAEVVASQALLDVLLEYPIDSDRALFSIDPRFRMLGLRTETTLRFLPSGGTERAFQFHDDPGLVRLDPRWFQAARRFVVDGFFHILGGVDHLLFLLCLVIPFRRFGPLVTIVTGFTVAHSVTLIGSAYGLAPDVIWFPPLVETLIATSIVYMALENIVRPTPGHRWLIAFGFGLVHGFGFSFALRDSLQFAGNHLLTALLSFNIGVELGQLLLLIVCVPLLDALFRVGIAERMGTIVLSALVAHTAWHWMTERGRALTQYQFQWPSLDAAFFVIVVRWLMIAVALGAAAWFASVVRGRRSVRHGEGRA
jgi:hypothetical protein